jgi:hypothetical protein
MVARRTLLVASAGLAVAPLVGSAPAGADAETPGVAVAAPESPEGPDGTSTKAGQTGASFAGRPAPETPRTLAASRVVHGGRLRVAEASFPLTHLGVAWRGADAQVRVRSARGWSGWTSVAACGAGPDGRAGAGAAALITVRGAVGYEVAVAGSGTASVTELNTGVSPVQVASGVPMPGGTAPVPYLNRAAWGADESLRFSHGAEVWPAEYAPVQTLTVHHTAGSNGDPDPAGTVRAIYYYQCVTQGWGDIGYNLMIDEAGRVYEGRISGSDARPVYGPAGADGRPQMVIGGHVKEYNVGNVGVCLMGTFTSRQPTAAAQDALARVLSSLAVTGRLDVLSTVRYSNPENGNRRTVQTISGHRDWAATACPGDRFYPTLPALRTYVSASTFRRRLPEIPRPPKQPPHIP